MTMKMFFAVMAMVMLLSVPHAGAQDAFAAAHEKAAGCIQEMADNSIPTTRVNDLLGKMATVKERATLAASLANGELSGQTEEVARKTLDGLPEKEKSRAGVESLADEICAIRDSALMATDVLKVFSGDIKTYKDQRKQTPAGMFFSSQAKRQLVNTTEAEALLKQAHVAFAEERYEEADALLLQAQAILDEKEAEITTLNVITAAGKNFFEKNWPWILLAVIIISVSGWLAWKRWVIVRTRNTIARLKIEQCALMELMKNAQRDRLQKGTLPESVYRIKTDKYTARLAEIKQTLPVLEAMLKKKKGFAQSRSAGFSLRRVLPDSRTGMRKQANPAPKNSNVLTFRPGRKGLLAALKKKLGT